MYPPAPPSFHFATLQDLINDVLQPVPIGGDRLSLEKGITSIKLTIPPTASLKIKGKQVREIFVATHSIINTSNISDESNYKTFHILIVTDGDSGLYQIPRNINYFMNLCYLIGPLALLGAVQETGFMQPESRRSKNWDMQPIAKLYLAQEKDTYILIRRRVAEHLKSRIENSSLLERAKNNGILVFSIATGEGSDLERARKELETIAQVKGVGIDSNPDNIQRAKENKYNSPHLEFFCLDSDNIQELMERKLAVYPATKKPVVVVMMVGYATRHTMNGSRAAIALMQNIFSADLVVVTGLTPILFTQDIAERIGYQTHLAQFNLDVANGNTESLGRRFTFYSLTHPAPDIDQIEQIKSRSILYSKEKTFSFLDLSFHARPIDMLSQIINKNIPLTELTQIDLSYCNIPVDQINILIDKLKLLPNLKTVILEPESKNYDFINVLRKNAWTVIERQDVATSFREFEVPPLPRQYAEKLRIFDSLTYKLIHQPMNILGNKSSYPS